MTALEWIKQYEDYLALVKNHSNNTVRGYVADAELLQKFVKLANWAGFTPEMTTDYVRELKQTHKDGSVQRKIYSLRQFFKFLHTKGVVESEPFAEMKFRALQRPLPKF